MDSTMRQQVPASGNHSQSSFELSAVDGVPLAATLFSPIADGGAAEPIGAVIIVAGMGITQSFYAPLAQWLASRGFVVLTFDFRGVGASLRGPLAKVDVDLVGWARLDASAALKKLKEFAPNSPVTWVGHSFGGQILPFVANHHLIDKVVTIATGSGYWKQNAKQLRWKVPLLWYGLVPTLTPVFGYFPGRKLRMVGNMPKRAMLQWRRWCLNKDYAIGAEGGTVGELFAGVASPIFAISFSDDEMMSEQNTNAIHRCYTGAEVQMRRFQPHELGVERVGHFGFFRDPMATAWESTLLPELLFRKS
jgi:predicted alpha/beta hydrolase